MEYLHKGEDFSKIKAGGACPGYSEEDPFFIPMDECGTGEGGTSLGGGCYNYCSPTVNVKPCTWLY